MKNCMKYLRAKCMYKYEVFFTKVANFTKSCEFYNLLYSFYEKLYEIFTSKTNVFFECFF